MVPTRIDARILGLWEGVRGSDALSGSGREVMLFLEGPVPEIVVADHGVPILFRALTDCEGLEGEAFDTETAAAVSYTLVSVEMEHGEAPYSVVLWHGGAPRESLRDQIVRECGAEVKMRSLQTIPAAVDGLVSRWARLGSGGISLIPEEWKQAGASAASRTRLLTAVLAAGGIWVLGALLVWGGLFFAGRRLERLKSEQVSWQARGREVRDVRRRVHVIQRYMDTSHSALECLRELSVFIPDGVDLTSFSYRKGEEVKISGEAMTVADIYKFKSQLDQSKLFAGAVLNGPRRDARRGKELFDVDVRLSGGGGE
jgi:Tfp pilus assembly protein PilN